MSVHSSFFQPKIIPAKGDVDQAEIDRLQEISASATLNRTKIEEIGREGVVDWKKEIPTVTMSLRQLEYGSLEFYKKLANDVDATTNIPLTSFKTSESDIAIYTTDEDGDFTGTYWYPKQKVAGINLTIGDPEALIERNFSLTGEDAIILQNDNKYLIRLEDTATGSGHQIVIGSGGFSTYPDPVENPDASGTYFLRATRVRSSVTTTLVEGTDFVFNSGTNLISGLDSQASDVFIFLYSATTYISGVDPFVENDSDLSGITADSATIILQTGNTVSRLQSVGVDIALDRFDIREIGNTEVVSANVRDITVTANLGRVLETWSVEEILRGEVGTSYGLLDIREAATDVSLTILLYSDNTKGTFSIGYKFTEMTTGGSDTADTVNEFVNVGTQLTGEEGFISTVIGDF